MVNTPNIEAERPLLDRVKGTYDEDTDRIIVETFPKVLVRTWTRRGTSEDGHKFYKINVTETEPLGLLATLGLFKPRVEAKIREHIEPYESSGAFARVYNLSIVGGELQTISVQGVHAPECYEGDRLADAEWHLEELGWDEEQCLSRVDEILPQLSW